jgi:hypothetical protein
MELTLQIARLRPEASAQRTMQDNCLAFGHRDCQMRVYVGQGAADNRLRYWPRLRLMLAQLPLDHGDPAQQGGCVRQQWWKSISCTTRKKRCRPRLDKGGKNETYGIYGRAPYCAARVRLMQHLANCLYNRRDCVFAVSLRRSATWLALVSTLGSEV